MMVLFRTRLGKILIWQSLNTLKESPTLNYYNITHDIPDFVFKIVYLFNMNPANVCLLKSIIRRKFEICSQITI